MKQAFPAHTVDLWLNFAHTERIDTQAPKQQECSQRGQARDRQMRYRVNDFEIDTNAYSIKHRDMPIAVEPKVFDVIVYLIANRDRVVTRQAFFDAIWTGLAVSDATLSNHIKFARTALHDDGQRQAVIKTIHGRGYQFVAPVTDIPDPPTNASVLPEQTVPGGSQASSVHSRFNRFVFTAITLLTLAVLILFIWQINGGIAPSESDSSEPGVSAAADKSIAILPFAYASDTAEDAFFSDGMHSALLAQIAAYPALKTIAKGSVAYYDSATADVKAVGTTLSVATVLLGEVKRAGQQIRVDVQLIDTANARQLWAGTYTRALTAENIFIIQQAISLDIAKALNLALTAKQNSQHQHFPTQNLIALEYYFQGKSLANQGTTQDNTKAIVYLEQAIKADPSFALAYAELARLELNQIHWAGKSVEQQVRIASSLIERALALQPTLGEAFVALGVLHVFKQRFGDAETAFTQAIDIIPGNVTALSEYGNLLLWKLRRIEQAEAVFAKAVAISPLDPLLKTQWVSALIDAGRFAQARMIIDTLIEQNPTFAPAYRSRSDYYYWLGHALPASQVALSQNLQYSPEAPFNSMIMAQVYILTGDTQKAVDWLAHSLSLAPGSDNMLLANAMIAHLTGKHGKALDMFLQLPANQHVFPVYMFDLVEVGQGLGRARDVENHYRQFFPSLFQDAVNVDASNFIPAVAVARLMINRGEHARGHALLDKCLTVVTTAPFGGWSTKESDWKTRIYLAKGEVELAARSFADYVAAGHGADSIVTSPTYAPLKDHPVFQRALSDMQNTLKNARQRLRELEDSGEIMLPGSLNPHSQ